MLIISHERLALFLASHGVAPRADEGEKKKKLGEEKESEKIGFLDF